MKLLGQRIQFLPFGSKLAVREKRDALKPCFGKLVLFLVLLGLLKAVPGNLLVDSGAGHILKDVGAFLGAGIEEACKLSLGQQDGSLEGLYGQTCERFYHFFCLIDFFSQDFVHCAVAFKLVELHLRLLQLAVCFHPGPCLLPGRPVAAVSYGEVQFGKAVTRIPGHGFVAGGAELLQAGRLAVERKADCVKQGAFA